MYILNLVIVYNQSHGYDSLFFSQVFVLVLIFIKQRMLKDTGCLVINFFLFSFRVSKITCVLISLFFSVISYLFSRASHFFTLI